LQTQEETDRLPWAKFYFDRWLSDEELQECGLAAQGLWMNMLAIMAQKGRPYGHLRDKRGDFTIERLAEKLHKKPSEIRKLIAELEKNNVFSRTDTGTIFSRRQVRDFKVTQEMRRRGKQGAEARYGSLPDAIADSHSRSYSSGHSDEPSLDAMAEALAGSHSQSACAITRSRALCSASDSAIASEVFPEGGAGGNRPDWPETLAAVREPFPDADEIIAERIVLEALRAKSTADDAEIAAAVRATFKRRVQKSPGLWLQTVPAFLRNGAPKSREYHQPACLICQDTGRVLCAGITEKPGWVELPESELYVSCECQKVAKAVTA